jgi:hypothetical protein
MTTCQEFDHNQEFTREELQALRARAHYFAQTPHLNPSWQRRYEDLAMAADALDACLARLTVGAAADPGHKA